MIFYDIVWVGILTNQKPTIYRDLYENTGPGILLIIHIANMSNYTGY